MKSKLFGFNAKMALAALAVCGTFTSCYEKEEVDYVPTPTLPDPEYAVVGSVYGKQADGSQKPLENITVTLTQGANTVTATTDVNGFYMIEDLTSGSCIVSVDAADYLKASRTIYLQSVGKGETSLATADFVLLSVNSSEVVPPVAVPEEPNKSEVAIQEEAVKEAAKEALASIEGVNVADMTSRVNELGDIEVTVPVTVAGASAGEPTQVKIPVVEGFSSSVVPTYARAIAWEDMWIKAVEAELGMSYGMVSKTITYTIPAVAGLKLDKYELKLVMNSDKFTVKIDETDHEGIVTYQGQVLIKTSYENHGSHGDWHGVTPGAGGGASGNY